MNEPEKVDISLDGISTRIELAAGMAGGKKEFAKKIGISESQLYRYLSGDRDLKAAVALRMAKESGVNLMWLLTGEGPKTVSEAHQAAKIDEESIHDEYAFIPGYNIQVSAGHGALAESETISRKLAFRRKWLKFKGLHEKNLVVVFAKGDSMEPTISDNDTIMVDTSNNSPQDGRMYVIRVDGHLVVKRTSLVPGQGVLLISDNKDYPPNLVKFDTSNPDLEVIGRVVWVGKDF
ncbi:helix-turn-helix transcriptional regulator [Oceanobacter sp. 4_MG-2023]|uniref:LexA family transcriptional regulator n=1 Tax=Oceanobacter sp. 4_MG-2023 TaxID=3062623 RepID=UPI00273320C6|nr:helix-turn-helix transcriptional regulator [Oceanobacter sp. 4_MG-2023]MDP2549471.1 helix-turn-helix transcriptional regulator [Oceanobacter sp. 4_MG-2023]